MVFAISNNKNILNDQHIRSNSSPFIATVLVIASGQFRFLATTQLKIIELHQKKVWFAEGLWIFPVAQIDISQKEKVLVGKRMYYI